MSMKSLVNMSIKNKLTLMIIVSTLLGVMLISSIFVYQRYVSFKTQMSNEFTAIAKIISDRSNAAVLFEDQLALAETLASLSLHEQVTLACIYNRDQILLANFTRDAMQFVCPTHPAEHGQSFSRAYFHVSEPIMVADEAQGQVYIRASTRQLDQEIHASLLSAATLSSLAVLGALVFARYVQRFISDPLIELQRIARKVTIEHDFSPRAQKKHDDEIGELVEAFNTMLETIAEQNVVIAEHTENLEKKVEERTAELEMANHELEAFSYSVSHDLKAPLRKIDGFSRALEEDYAQHLDEDGLNYLARLRSNSQKMSQLITSLLQLSRVTRKEIDKQRFSLSEAAHQILESLKESEPQREVTVKVSPGLIAEGDPKLVEILLDNLIGNAWKYSRNQASTYIEVGMIAGKHPPVYYVRDNGCGFDMSYADRLFKPFTRLHSTEQFEGTGIGLATTGRIVARHRGRIWAESQPEQGSTFFFTLEAETNASGVTLST
ncbi:MAG: ATP-binding protein [Oleiphilaceae bacterium]|nr:ATP-binding protein [Oleiphilaceae bacterium]